MKISKSIVLAVALFFLLPILPARASDYGVLKTCWSFAGNWTNSPTVATNLNAAVNCTTFTEFTLQLLAYGTNNQGGAGSFDFVWETSADGTNWPMSTNAAVGRS